MCFLQRVADMSVTCHSMAAKGCLTSNWSILFSIQPEALSLLPFVLHPPVWFTNTPLPFPHPRLQPPTPGTPLRALSPAPRCPRHRTGGRWASAASSPATTCLGGGSGSATDGSARLGEARRRHGRHMRRHGGSAAADRRMVEGGDGAGGWDGCSSLGGILRTQAVKNQVQHTPRLESK